MYPLTVDAGLCPACIHETSYVSCHDHHITNLAARYAHVQHVLCMYYSAAGLHFSAFIVS